MVCRWEKGKYSYERLGQNVRKSNILIWGTGVRGEDVYQMLKQHRGYRIVAFGDNNKEFWGKEKFQKPIMGPKDILGFTDLDCIIIAAADAQEIKKQLEQITSIPVYCNIDDLMISRISIDISGFCNAKCKWCVTGRKNRSQQTLNVHYMVYDEFVDLYRHLYQSEIIEKSTEIMLYSWGEPLLNKDYVNIVEYLAEQKQKFSVSTNASKVQLLNRDDAYENCCAFIFSMPGFSQVSYDRMHGFSFNQIKKNIEMLNANLREAGFKGDGSLSFHVYRFNTNEIEAAREFAESLNLRFNPYYPYFNGNSMTEEYLEGRLEKEIIKEATEELYLSHVKELLCKRPLEYRCFLENIISIDDKNNLVLCCASDEGCTDYKWNSVFNISSLEEMRKMRKKMLECSSCKKCRQLGIDYWMGNNPGYLDERKK